jgi:lysophospholipid acyltransferase (LPLAT)-like uncharacterized protein
VKIVPLAARASAFWQLGSWDGFIIPKPFARVTIAYGEPVFVTAESSRAAAEMTSLVSSAMGDAHRRLDAP